MSDGSQQNEALQRVLERASLDTAFRAQLLDDTTAVLRANGVPVREGLTVKAVEDTATVAHLILPPANELSDAQLDKVSGGISPAYLCTTPF